MHRTTARFWTSFGTLPREVQSIARKKFEILKIDPAHPSLHLKKVGRFWSARIDLDHRALGIRDGSDFIWVWIGSHSEYRELIGR